MSVAASPSVGILLKWRWPAAGAFLVVCAVVVPHDPAAGPPFQREVNLMLALVLGPLAAIAVAFTLESLDTRMRTEADVTAALGLPLLGSMSTARATAVNGEPPLLGRGVSGAFSEAIRGLRRGVIGASAAGAPRRVMVTSTAQGEGKSFLASNLAESLGHARQRTLLIDGDMRRPRVHEIFACGLAPGLSDALSGAADVRAMIRPTANRFLWLLPAGRCDSDPMKLLGPLEYTRILDELAKDFDWIVVDAPPALAAGDAVLMAVEGSSVLFVVGAEMVRPRTARAALEQLARGRARIVGVALNRSGTRAAPGFAGQHRSAYTQTCGAHRL